MRASARALRDGPTLIDYELLDSKMINFIQKSKMKEIFQ
jgi:hypothetical protein